MKPAFRKCQISRHAESRWRKRGVRGAAPQAAKIRSAPPETCSSPAACPRSSHRRFTSPPCSPLKEISAEPVEDQPKKRISRNNDPINGLHMFKVWEEPIKRRHNQQDQQQT